jgi:FkbM family methyltransferase
VARSPRASRDLLDLQGPGAVVLPARVSSKPQYVLHPLRALRRVGRVVKGPRPEGRSRVARLPWGIELTVQESDAIGYSILVGRVFDPCVTETIHRLVDSGDVVVDVGANVGYLTSLGAVRAGQSGRVIAVEPHPAVFELLRSNAESWSGNPTAAPVELHRLALSNHTGVGAIVTGPHFESNMGLARLAEGDAEGEQSHEVELRRLDELIDQTSVGLLKVDVEGHEAEVLAGASELLERRLVRDIIFEDHAPYPSEATAVVEQAGYRLVSLSNDLRGLLVNPPHERGPASAWPGPSYLATIDPDRSLARLKAKGWQVGGIGIGRSR